MTTWEVAATTITGDLVAHAAGDEQDPTAAIAALFTAAHAVLDAAAGDPCQDVVFVQLYLGTDFVAAVSPGDGSDNQGSHHDLDVQRARFEVVGAHPCDPRTAPVAGGQVPVGYCPN